MSKFFEVRVSGPEWQYLQKSDLLPLDLQRIVTTAEALSGDAYLLRIPEPRMEESGDALTDRLAKTGFDKVYKLTDEGRMLEDLIDRFMIP